MTLRTPRPRLGLFAALAAFALAGCSAPEQAGESLGSTSQALSTGLVISQVYGGGGGSGTTGVWAKDYIEIFNRGTTAVPLSGKSVQYASATGSSWGVITLSTTAPDLLPGRYYLIETGSAGTGTETAPTADQTTGGTPMAATGGKVALVQGTTALTCGAADAGTKCATDPNVIDLVGYGTASDFEAAPTAATSTTTAAVRKNGGCTETDNNSADFDVVAPTFRTSASPARLCSGDAGTDTGAADSSATDTGPADTGAADTGKADTGTSDSGATDAGATDVGATDAGATDAGALDSGKADTGTAPADTGTAPADTGTAPADTGTAPADTGSPAADTGSGKADTGIGTVAPVDTGSGDEGCGCRTPAGGATHDGVALAALALGLAVAARRRK